MKIKTVLALIIISAIIFNYTGCSDSLTSTNNINGKVSGHDNIPQRGLRVTSGDKTTYTSSDGSFTFENVTYPYDLAVLDTFYRSVSLYKNISTDKLNLYIDKPGYPRTYSYIRIILPVNINLQVLNCMAFFTDGQSLNSSFRLNNSSNVFSVLLPDNNSVSGKLIILTYKTDNYGKITSYENYGESGMLNLLPDNDIDYTFDSLSLSLNPGEQTVLGNMTINPGPFTISSGYFISFGNLNTRTDNFLSGFTGRIFNFIIPSGIPRVFNTYINNTVYFASSYSNEIFHVYPDATNTLVVKDECSLITPANQAENVTNETAFSFQGGTGNGIYVICIHDILTEKDFRIITTDNNFTLSGLDQLGLGYISNHFLSWYVRQEGPAGSVNDYVNNFTNIQERFITSSEIRTFSTSP
jgi:hypothetical protein